MAEWIVLILIMLIVPAAWYVSQQFSDTRPVLVTWFVAAIIIFGILMVYVSAKVRQASRGWIDQYQIQQDR